MCSKGRQRGQAGHCTLGWVPMGSAHLSCQEMLYWQRGSWGDTQHGAGRFLEASVTRLMLRVLLWGPEGPRCHPSSGMRSAYFQLNISLTTDETGRDHTFRRSGSLGNCVGSPAWPPRLLMVAWCPPLRLWGLTASLDENHVCGKICWPCTNSPSFPSSHDSAP